MELKVDEKWSISYDPDNNDRPLKLFRYGEYAGVDMHNQKNYVLKSKDAAAERLNNARNSL